MNYGVGLYTIGYVKKGGGVTIEHQDRIGNMFQLDSQRFSTDSWFTAGIDSYIDLLINHPIVVD